MIKKKEDDESQALFSCVSMLDGDVEAELVPEDLSCVMDAVLVEVVMLPDVPDGCKLKSDCKAGEIVPCVYCLCDTTAIH